MMKLAVFSVLVAFAYASGPAQYAQKTNEAHVNYVNGVRQAHVNHVAEHVGAGTGTADRYGVPGTGVGYGHYPAYRYGHGYDGHAHGYGYGHAYDGYAHGYYDNAVHANAVNAHRQHYVNQQAKAVGAGTGTAYRDGVPGTILSGHYGHPY